MTGPRWSTTWLRQRRRARAAVLLALALLGGAGCKGMESTPLPTKCTKIGEQCQLPSSGPLGVCNSMACKAGETPPCLQCMPQH